MAEEPEYYRAQPLPPRDGSRAGGYGTGGHGGPAGGGFGGVGPGAGYPRPAGGYGAGVGNGTGGYGARAAGAVGPVVVVGAKSALIGYVLWFFLGWLGIHKFYLAQPFQGLFYILLWVTGAATVGILVGWFLLALWGLLMLVDLFVIPLRTAQLNARAVRRAQGW